MNFILGKWIPAPRARAVLLAACLLPLVISAWLIVALPQSPDLWYYKLWSRLVTRHGISAAYSGKPVADHVDYPPVLLYPWRVEGELYQRFIDPRFDEEEMLENEAHTFGLAMIATFFHIATGLALYRLARIRHAAPTATAVAAVYLLNPAALCNTAYLGLPDSVHSLWLVLAFGLAEAGRVRAGWVAATLAALTKPQAWGLLPLFVWRRLTADSAKTTLGGIVAGMAATTAVAAPFIVNGTLMNLLSLPVHMEDVQAVVSAQAHNLWWLATLGNGLRVRDDLAILGPVTYQHLALGLLAASGIFSLWCARRARTGLMLTLPAFQAFAWFCLTTRAHENHWFFVLPLLALALADEPRMIRFFVAVTVTGFVNLALHDEVLGGWLQAVTSHGFVQDWQIVNSAANLAILAAWTFWLVRQARVSATTPDPRPPAAGG